MEGIDLVVLSREEAEKFVPASPTAYVSIYTPKDAPATFQGHGQIYNVLKIAFDDLSEEKFRGLSFGEPWNRPIELITDAHALEIKDFVQASYDRGIRHFMIHCDAGISRSTGVACALDFVFNNAQRPRPRYCMHNKLVYTKVLIAFKGPIVQHD
jgi:predicted protein tyrosine phosphatase